MPWTPKTLVDKQELLSTGEREKRERELEYSIVQVEGLEFKIWTI